MGTKLKVGPEIYCNKGRHLILRAIYFSIYA